MSTPFAPVEPADFLLEQWQRILLGPEPAVPPEALAAHVAGTTPLRVNPLGGGDLTRCGALTLIPGGDRLPIAFRLYTESVDAGISTGIVELPNGGCRLWVFAQPGPVTLMRDIIARLQNRVREKDKLALIEEGEVPLDPYFDPAVGRWSSWVDVKMVQHPPALVNFTADRIRHQASLLARFRATPLDMLREVSESAVNRHGLRGSPVDMAMWLSRICQSDPSLGLTPELLQRTAQALGLPVEQWIAQTLAAHSMADEGESLLLKIARTIAGAFKA